MNDPYAGREQTRAKHLILNEYLKKLAFKILSARDEFVYVDAFSGPWEERTSDFSDTSFGIAISTLTDIHEYFSKKGKVKSIRCFLVEKNLTAFEKLEAAVLPHHDKQKGIQVKPYRGEFEKAIPEIIEFVRDSFALTFIDPTGWTGYSYEQIRPLLRHDPGEVLINFMFDFANRAAGMDIPKIERSFDPILGGPGWRNRLDPRLPRGKAIVKLFDEELKSAGDYEYVVSTPVPRATANRIHFFMVYATRSDEGLKTFRDCEARMLREYFKIRADAKIRRHANEMGMDDLFLEHGQAEQHTYERSVDAEKAAAKEEIIQHLISSPHQISFLLLRNEVMKRFRLRETDVKDICVELAKDGSIENTWKDKRPKQQKPRGMDVIRLASPDE